MAKKRILSGMRPTGPLHLGHLVGALRNWRDLQDEYECYYFVADWHALMSEYHDTSGIAEHGRIMVAEWIACGLDPDKCVIFRQVDIPEHTELHLVLSCITPIGWLERCPTYKEQLKQLAAKDVNTYAFLGYPTLQAADIMLYRAQFVPVGEDQLPHVEITREIARRFNSLFDPVFPEPQGKLTPIPRLLGLDRRKMSKSYDNFIGLADEPEDIRSKVMTMITDPQRARRADPGRPDYCNLHSYYRAFIPDEAEGVAEGCLNATAGCKECKARLAEALVEMLTPIREKRNELLESSGEVDAVLERGRERAGVVARETMKAVRGALKF